MSSCINDILKVAKVISMLRDKRSEIDATSLRVAACFFNHPEISIGANAVGEREALPGKEHLLGCFKKEPKIVFAKDVNLFKKTYGDSDWARISGRIEDPNPADADSEYGSLAKIVQEVTRAALGSENLNWENAEKFAAALSPRLENWISISSATRMSSTPAASDQSEFSGEPTVIKSTSLRKLAEQLGTRLFGQDIARDLLLEQLAMAELRTAGSRQPTIFVLAGPASSGKSTMAGIIQNFYPDRKCLQLNMGSFQSEKEGFGLTGLRAGWGDAAPGRLTGFVHDNPHSLIILDNIERAHPNVQSILSELFTKGAVAVVVYT